MSGPKNYSPPSRYSMDVFNGGLNSLFQLQTQIKEQIKKIECLLVNDAANNIKFDCLEDLSKIKEDLNSLLEPLILNYEGRFSQETFNTIQEEIIQRITDLHAQKNKLDIIESDFFEKQNDYDQYLTYVEYNEQSQISLNDFKDKTIESYSEEIEDVDKNTLKETLAEINKVTDPKINDTFSYGFSAIFESKKEEIIEVTKKKEAEINLIRTQKSKGILKPSSDISLEEEKEKVSEEVEKWIEKVTVLIENCFDAENKISYRSKLKNLLESKSLKEEYYYKELFDSIYLSEKKRKIKKEISVLLSALNSEDFHANLLSKKQLLGQRLSSLLNKSTIKEIDISGIKRELEALQQKNQLKKEEDAIIERERVFLKSQVVTTLANMGYEVMDDLEVIDFEKSNDYLLKVKGQDNYMNLMFSEDGAMKYNFQIPENKKDLSFDEKKLKVQEMKMSCDDFNSVISDLRKMGMKLNLNSEQPISEASLMPFTKKTKERLKGQQSKSKDEQQQIKLKKKYLE
jgi:hypothetical protein